MLWLRMFQRDIGDRCYLLCCFGAWVRMDWKEVESMMGGLVVVTLASS